MGSGETFIGRVGYDSRGAQGEEERFAAAKEKEVKVGENSSVCQIMQEGHQGQW